jgi:hypothetical protein
MSRPQSLRRRNRRISLARRKYIAQFRWQKPRRRSYINFLKLLLWRFKWFDISQRNQIVSCRAGNVFVGLPIFGLRIGIAVRQQFGRRPMWMRGWATRWFQAYPRIWTGGDGGRLVHRLFVTYEGRSLIRRIWRRYRGRRQIRRRLTWRRGGRLRICDVRRRFFRLVRRARGELRYLLGWFYRTRRLARLTKSLVMRPGYPLRLVPWGGSNLEFMLVIARFTRYWWESRYLITSGGVYINGQCCRDPQRPVSGGDIVQLVIGKEFLYYQQCAWQLWGWYRRLQVRPRRRVTGHWWQYLIRKVPRYSKWLFRVLHPWGDVGKHMEVDYTVGSIYVLYSPFLINHVNGFFLRSFHWYYWPIYSWRV